MPLYHWQDKKTKKNKHVMREYADYRQPPTQEEATVRQDVDMGDEVFTEAEFAEAEWEKLISSGIRVTKGANWNYSKGNP